MKPTFLTKKSSKNNFISLSVSLEMQNPESVIKVYKKVSKFKGVIAL
jgi:putative lipoic acid-binding regulatory protein